MASGKVEWLLDELDRLAEELCVGVETVDTVDADLTAVLEIGIEMREKLVLLRQALEE